MYIVKSDDFLISFYDISHFEIGFVEIGYRRLEVYSVSIIILTDNVVWLICFVILVPQLVHNTLVLIVSFVLLLLSS